MIKLSEVKRKIGDTVQLLLELSEGDVSIVSGVTATMKTVDPDTFDIPDEPLVDVDFGVSLDVPSKTWTITLASGVTATFPPGLYAYDVRIELVGGEAVHTDRGYVRFMESVT